MGSKAEGRVQVSEEHMVFPLGGSTAQKNIVCALLPFSWDTYYYVPMACVGLTCAEMCDRAANICMPTDKNVV